MDNIKEHFAEAQRKRNTQWIISNAIKNSKVGSQAELAGQLGITQGAVSKKIKDNYWTLEELVVLFRILGLSIDDAAVMLGIKNKM